MKVTVTEAMVDAAIDAGSRRGVIARGDIEAVRAMLQAALSLAGRGELGVAFPLEVVGPVRTRLRARFVRMGEQRGYMTVETKDGQTLNIHANEVFNRRGDR